VVDSGYVADLGAYRCFDQKLCYGIRPQALACLGVSDRLAARPGVPFGLLIVYRRLTMNGVEPLDRRTAETYASWFKALADGTRVQVVSLLARAGRPLTVKEIVAAVPVGQSTVSEHLRLLAAVGFVLAEERGTSRLYRINTNCVSCFPTAADLVMGKPSPVPSAIPAA
jgi:DNA-binding transcriptional ArsR family regulator